MEQSKRRWFFHVDWLLLLSVLALCVIGVIAIANATLTDPQGWTTVSDFFASLNTYYARLHALWILLGLVAMVGGMIFDTKIYNALSHGVYWFIMLLLLVTAFMPAISGTSAWIQITENRTLQPAELAKIALIIMLARQLGKLDNGIQHISELWLPLLFSVIPIALIVAQREGGSAIVLAFVIAVMFFASGTNWRVLLGLAVAATIAAVVMLYILNETGSFRIQRILSFLDQSSDIQGDNWTVNNSKMAIGSAGLYGKGLFQPGTLTALRFVPQNHTDFIFSSWAEATGFVGAIGVIILFLIVLAREIRLAYLVKNRFGSLVIIGVAAMQFVHIFENIGMCIGVMPVMGIPLPFISYGGTSMLTNMLAVGLVLGIGMRRQQWIYQY